MRKIKLFKDRKGQDLVPVLVDSSAGRYEVVAPVSSVRIGETERKLVKSKDCVDYPKWVTLFVSKDVKECKKWLAKYRTAVLKLCTPYEVSS